MRLNLSSCALLLALFIVNPASAATYQEGLISSFPNNGTTFTPSIIMQERLQYAPRASMIVINGRTSTAKNSAADELLALKRALSARKYIIEKYAVSPLKIQVNFVSASDYITENVTTQGQLENQRVEIIMHFLQPEVEHEIRRESAKKRTQTITLQNKRGERTFNQETHPKASVTINGANFAPIKPAQPRPAKVHVKTNPIDLF
jgi:hypothetical protein